MTLIPLWTDETNRRAAFYDHGTQVCLRCPLHPLTCAEMIEANGVRSRAHIPDCLQAYALWMIEGEADVVLAIADDVAQKIGDNKMFVALFEQAIDDISEEQIRQQGQARTYRRPASKLVIEGLARAA